MRTKAVFFDRDGVINHLVKRPNGHLTSPWHKDELVYCDHAQESIKSVQAAGFLTFIVTNQPGIADGDMTATNLHQINNMLYSDLGVKEILCATNKATDWYKPNNGMIEFLLKEYAIDRDTSFLIGDRWKDIVPGNASGLTTILVGTRDKYNYLSEMPANATPNCFAKDIREACQFIINDGE